MPGSYSKDLPRFTILFGSKALVVMPIKQNDPSRYSDILRLSCETYRLT